MTRSLRLIRTAQPQPLPAQSRPAQSRPAQPRPEPTRLEPTRVADPARVAEPRTSHTITCRLIGQPDELAAHHAIRCAVFVAEQGVFAESDVDEHDADPRTLHVLGLVDGVPAGTVRLFGLGPVDPSPDWLGDRLAVLPEFRTSGLGAPLVRFAVATAAARGGSTMFAHIQPANRTFFLRLGWSQDADLEVYLGRPHLPMRIELPATPPRTSGRTAPGRR